MPYDRTLSVNFQMPALLFSSSSSGLWHTSCFHAWDRALERNGRERGKNGPVE